MNLEQLLQYKRNIDLDLSNRCPIQCPMCWRQTEAPESRKRGHDMTMDDFLKVVDFVSSGPTDGFIFFAGAASDPIHHPKLIDFLKICAERDVLCEVQTASSFKSEKWFIEAFKAHPNARWQFGIDGLPEHSHKYRINQDGKKLFSMMQEAIKYLNTEPIWQYIVFKYNEKHVEYCKAWALEMGCKFKLVKSGKNTDLVSSPYGENEDVYSSYVPSKDDYKVSRNDDLENILIFRTHENDR